MKKLITTLVVLCSAAGYAQVGIGTTTPRDALDVVGNILLENYLILDNTVAATGDYRLLVRSTESSPVGEVKRLDVDVRNVGPINKYSVQIQNVNKLSVVELSTNLEVSKYYLGLAEGVFSGATIMSASNYNGDPVYGTYFTAVKEKNGKYVISLNFNNATTSGTNSNGNWDLSFIVFEKTLVKDWGNYTGSVTQANSYSGVSTNTPIGLQ
ncbi:hypothetical protein [Kaistella palustris]|uniref:hypothetical protein n=1 Tax=Kaistella palustris TaxID=493376 RepID=UPI0004122718|nr:hypothetical protein [Kaistella palustris]